jgi:hypothetical protein
VRNERSEPGTAAQDHRGVRIKSIVGAALRAARK